MKNFLPSFGELKRRHVRDDGLCLMCGHTDESLFHALVQCEHARMFWNATLDFFQVKLPKLHPSTWTLDLLDSKMVQKDQATIIISVMWTIWSSRNKYTHEEIKYQPHKSVELVDELIKSMNIPSPARAATVSTLVWRPPAHGWTKMNTDGALNQSEREAAMGIVARDSTGCFLMAGFSKYSAIDDPFTVGILGCRDAMRLAMEKSISHVIIETDCQNVSTLWYQGVDINWWTSF